MGAVARRPPLRFRGTPASLAAVIAEAPDPADTLTLVAALGGATDGEPIEIPVQTDFDPRILRISLPQDVPPGVYRGALRLGDAEYEAAIEVDPAPLLHVVPEQLRVQTRPGDFVGADLTILNQGNVPVTLRGAQAAGMFMNGGVEKALRLAYTRKLSASERRVDILADNLAEAHGGLLKMKLEQGAGELRPGEVRDLHLILHVPSDLAGGTVYSGNWEMPGLVYPIMLHVENGGSAHDESGAEPAQPPPKAPKKRPSGRKGGATDTGTAGKARRGSRGGKGGEGGE